MTNTTKLPEVGKYLYASCLGEDYGKILAVGHDENGKPTIDIEVYDAGLLLSYDEDSNALTEIELPPSTTVVLRKVQWKAADEWDGKLVIECNTPGNNCYRCTKLFCLNDERTAWIRPTGRGIVNALSDSVGEVLIQPE